MGRPMGAVESRSRERRLQEQQRLEAQAHRPTREGEKPGRVTGKLRREWTRMVAAFRRGAEETK